QVAGGDDRRRRERRSGRGVTLLTMLNLPRVLSTPVRIKGRVVSKVMLDLTVYLSGPEEDELNYLIDLYQQICPVDRWVKYKISDLQFWCRFDEPILTSSGRAAAANRLPRPYLAPVLRRIREGRAFEIGYWDGKRIEDPTGSWSFRCRRIHLRSSGL